MKLKQSKPLLKQIHGKWRVYEDRSHLDPTRYMLRYMTWSGQYEGYATPIEAWQNYKPIYS